MSETSDGIFEELVKLRDRNAVHINMLRGYIAIPSPEQMFHLWAIDDKALLEAVKAEARNLPPHSS